MAEPLLEVTDLSVDYLTEAADVRAVDRVSFTVQPGEFLGDYIWIADDTVRPACQGPPLHRVGPDVS